MSLPNGLAPWPAAGCTDARREAWSCPFELAACDDLGFDHAIQRVEAALRLGIDPSLEPVRALLAELGHPERSFACVQVAGTNGKTSTSRYTAALLAAEGLRCGLYTSPHLVDYTERVEVAGTPIGRAAFAHGVSLALAAWKRVCARDARMAGQGCTEFELLTAAAMAMFAEARVEVAVLEVGLGGRWDATSAVETVAAAVTGIGLDHTGMLGDTLEAIAGEKAAVLRPGIPCVLGGNALRPQGVFDVMLARCRAVGVVPAAVVEVDAAGNPVVEEGRGDNYGGPPASGALACPRVAWHVAHCPRGLGDELVVDVAVEISLPAGGRVAAAYPACTLIAPRYQAQNVACALALATAVCGRALKVDAVRASLARCPVPGRFEVVRREPLALLDACHNPQSARAFACAVEELQPIRELRPTLLLGVLADKDHRGVVEAVAPLFDRIVVTQSSSPRSFPATDLACEVREVCGGAGPSAVCEDVRGALDLLDGQAFVCCGTITLIGELAALLRAAV